MVDPTALIAKLQSSFENARNTGDLHFFPSTIVTHVDSDIEYEIRLCPALEHKSAPNLQADVTGDAGIATQGNVGKVFDPFIPPYNVNLYIGDLKYEEAQEEFVVLLNKFAVVPQHFLLVTKEFKSQASPLTPSELLQTYLLLSAARKSGKKFFAFYNCGGNSGASQPHKHIQFIPLESEDGPPIDRLARRAHIELPEKPFSLHQLSYASHSYRFPSYFDTYPSDRLEMILSDVFLQLLDLAISTIRHHPDYPVGSPSYNVIMTLEYMHIIPRRQDSYVLQETGKKLSVNALGFAGMLLARSEQEVEAVKRESISKILRGVGLEIVDDSNRITCQS
ncbi:hypothetical protein BYT27DRAFT_7180611 [Phlegmacium glaucopus]|nr:hypothetical protein BYT27DRAFT_7180611 [Phlegmacium glaucopus]